MCTVSALMVCNVRHCRQMAHSEEAKRMNELDPEWKRRRRRRKNYVKFGLSCHTMLLNSFLNLWQYVDSDSQKGKYLNRTQSWIASSTLSPPRKTNKSWLSTRTIKCRPLKRTHTQSVRLCFQRREWLDADILLLCSSAVHFVALENNLWLWLSKFVILLHYGNDCVHPLDFLSSSAASMQKED